MDRFNPENEKSKDERFFTITTPKLIKAQNGEYMIKVRCRGNTYTYATETKNKEIAESQVGLWVECIRTRLDADEMAEMLDGLNAYTDELEAENKSLKEEIASLKSAKK